MQTENELTAAAMQRKGRLMLLSLLIFFTVPLLVVMAMYKLDWKPQGESIGELIKPAHLLVPDGTLQTQNGELIAPAFWKDKWSFVYIANHCEARCEARLHDMRQLHVSMYKDMLRMQRVFITPMPGVAVTQARYPDMTIINQPRENLGLFSQQFSGVGPEMNAGYLYLVDPLGHVMMRYAPDIPATKIRKELARLLRYSWAG